MLINGNDTEPGVRAMEGMRARATERIRMKEVAEAAGVSVNTVSRALNGKSEISPETRARILEVAAKVGYRPNRLARRFRSSKTGTIGVVVADIAKTLISLCW